jgi:ABC-type lipoprotein release transport system permease subunit
MRLLQSQLYGVTPTDPAIYFAVPAVLLASTLVAATIPAARAARVDPLTALKAE